MLRFFVLLLLVCAVVARRPHLERERDDDDLWEKFKDKFDKEYESDDEEQKRRGTFFKHVDIITRHNLEADLGLHSFRLGLNEYADMENDEFRRTLNGYRMKDRRELPHREHYQPRRGRDIPDTIDWRDKGMVTPIKNQGQCGSCWAFSTTGSVEGQTMKKTGKLVSLSEQNLVDCSGKQGNEGCEGGLMDQAFEYIIENKGIDTEASYPYTAEDGTCKFKRSTVGATITGYKDIPSGDEDALKQAAATIGPISVAIDASSILFQLYSGGIYDDPDCSTDLLDHGVLVIGYGTDEGQDYWLVKNSWGTSWGLDGYIKMSRNKSNQCGIATQASYPTV